MKESTKDKKENLKVQNLYDREGTSEQTIPEEKEMIKIVESWGDGNDFKALLKKEGIFRNSQTFGNKVELELDTRNNEISAYTQVQNNTRFSESFFIPLVSFEEIDFSDHQCCEGDDMIAEVSGEFLIENIDAINNVDDIEEYLETEKLENGNYKISWWGNEEYVEAEEFVEKFMNEKWSDWTETYENWLLEDVTINYSAITEYYQEIRDNQDTSDTPDSL